MNLQELLHITENIVNDLTIKIDNQEMDHKTLEEEILKHINKIGNLMEQEILEKVKEPTIENKIIINGKQAVFNQKRNLRFINRFGYTTVISRRCYNYVNENLL